MITWKSIFTRFDNRIAEISQIKFEAGWVYPLLIFAISAFGFYFRIRGITWGIPLESDQLMSYHFDEKNYLLGIGRMRPSHLDFNVHDFHWGTAHHYILWIALKIAQLFGYMDVSLARFFNRFDMQEATRVFVSGRMVSVLFGTLTIPLVFIIGKKLQGVRAGLIASLFIAFLPLHVVNAHYLTADITMCFFLLITFYVSLLTFRSSNRRLYVMQGLLCGFAVATKYNASFMIFAIIASHLLQRETSWKIKGIAYLFIPAGFLIGEPYALLSFNEFYLQSKQFLIGGSGHKGNMGMTLLNLQLHLKYMFLYTMGIFPTGVSFVGILFLLKRRLKQDIFLLSTIAALSASVMFSNFVMVRYTVPLLAILTLCSALFIDQLKGKRTKFFLIILVVLFELCISVANVKVMTEEHTATTAYKWVDENVEPGSSLFQVWRGIPPLQPHRYKVYDYTLIDPERGFKLKPDYVIRTNLMPILYNKILLEQLNKYYKLLATFEKTQPSFLGIKDNDVPHDLKYTHPKVSVYGLSTTLASRSAKKYSVNNSLINFKDNSSRKYLRRGWSQTESYGTWAEGKESVVIVNLEETGNYLMRIKATPYTVSDRRQAVKVFVNDEFIGEHTFTKPFLQWEVFEIKIPAKSLRQGTTRIRFVYRYAISPKEMNRGSDTRKLAVAFESIEFAKL